MKKYTIEIDVESELKISTIIMETMRKINECKKEIERLNNEFNKL